VSAGVSQAHEWRKALTMESNVAGCSVGVYIRKRGDEEMTEQQLLERITLNPKVMVGKPVIKGTRLTVEYILNLLAHGATVTEILQEYQGLTPEDIQACVLFATKSLANTRIGTSLTAESQGSPFAQ
jgi:uncharacterized protein (DUF433 family)